MSGAEGREARLKRMRMRAWRRGTREMDLILGPHADRHLGTKDEAALALFEAVLGEADHDLYAWVTGREAAPARYAPLLDQLAAESRIAR